MTTEAIPGGVLPVCAIYGGNASGKSNAVQALGFFVEAIRSSYRRWDPDAKIPINRFASARAESSEPSNFSLDFVFANVRYEYGFSLTSEAFIREWLYAYPEGRKQIWFSRAAGSPILFGPKLKGQNRAIETLTRQNSLFLSTAAQTGHEQLSKLWAFFEQNILVDRTGAIYRLNNLANYIGPSTEEYVVAMLAAAELGIVGVRKYQEEIRHPPSRLGDFIASDDDPNFRTRKRNRVRLIHEIEGSRVELDEELESDGTRTFATRLPSISAVLANGGSLIIDEIDRSLHPALCVRTISLFLSPLINTKSAQLIFTTHDATLLSSCLLRRDEVWFSEKNKDGASAIYPLSDFAPRKGENLERGYLQGRYGGIPILNEAQFLAAFKPGEPDE